MIRKIVLKKDIEEKIGTDKLDVGLFDVKKQISYINQLYLNQKFTGDDVIARELKKKINSYKGQDQKKNKFNDDCFIKLDDLLEKLVVSKLKCTYCKQSVCIMYKNKREPSQWTLDRVDNNNGHTNKNTVISCLKCNLERRCINDKKFKFTKQMRLIKKN